MNSRNEKDKTKQLQDKCQSVLSALLRDEDNKYCVDCDSKGNFNNSSIIAIMWKKNQLGQYEHPAGERNLCEHRYFLCAAVKSMLN